ncbi:hypothetical protein V2O64_08970 [Verrucomicrobiaceae bacterium 227]
MRLLSSSLSLTAFAAAIAVGVRNNERESLSLENADSESSLPTKWEPYPSNRKHTPKPAPVAPHHDLIDLTQSLALSHRQQREIHPALLRARPEYTPSVPYLTLGSSQPTFLGPPLGRADFEDALFAILDGEQQLDYVAAVTESDAWWRSLISRLEADLENQTDPLDQLPTPGPPLPGPIAPSPNRGRQLTLPPTEE